jgi:hypothetical protein
MLLWGATVTNEQYLYASYFATAAAGALAAIVMAVWLGRSHPEVADGPPAMRLGRVIRRAFPPWLILAVLLGFMSVTYFDCNHSSYTQIVEHRGYLTSKTQEQVSAMARHLAAAIMGYGFVMVLVLWSRTRRV